MSVDGTESKHHDKEPIMSTRVKQVSLALFIAVIVGSFGLFPNSAKASEIFICHYEEELRDWVKQPLSNIDEIISHLNDPNDRWTGDPVHWGDGQWKFDYDCKPGVSKNAVFGPNSLTGFWAW